MVRDNPRSPDKVKLPITECRLSRWLVVLSGSSGPVLGMRTRAVYATATPAEGGGAGWAAVSSWLALREAVRVAPRSMI